MDSLLNADTFFFITAIVTVVIGLLFSILLVYLIAIMKDFKEISRKIKTETELVSEDIATMRSKVKKEGAKLKHFAEFANDIYKHTKKNFKK